VKRKRPTSAPWHFINLHFWPDGQVSDNQPAPENVVAAIKRFSVVLGDHSKTDIERAEALRWVLHFVGDVHQPLHSCARDTNDHPYGDKGGNDFDIIAPTGISPAPKNLHFLWDLGGGLFPGTRRPLTPTGLGRIERLAQALVDANGAAAEKAVTTMDPIKWAQEGLAIAKSSVYAGIEEGEEPSEAYLSKTREISGLRVTIAGFRLAKLLNSSLSK
jgi:hypothetical protein